LMADFFDWSGFQAVGCHNSEVAQQVQNMLTNQAYLPTVRVEPNWYY
jgi:hypothetical protein